MSKLFIKTIIQYGGDLSDADKVAVLNILAKKINMKMKIMEYTYKIQLKLEKLPESNGDCLPKKIGIQGIAQFDGPLRGQIPYYTNTEFSIPTPTISAITTGIPLTPFGPIIGVPGLAINPFGNTNTLEERIKKANETLEKIIQLTEKLKTSDETGNKIEDSDPLKKYFTYVNLEDPDVIEEIKKILKKY
jgi:hypothetical protein